MAKLESVLSFVGLSPKTSLNNLLGLFGFYQDYLKLKNQLKGNNEFPFGKLYPMLADKNAESGTLSGHYFHQDLLVAKKIFKNNPYKHVDVGSKTDGFVAHVASYREIEVFDIRPLVSKVDNIKFIQADFMSLDKRLLNYTDSISCLHAIEHFGLGRYSDPIDAWGHLKGLECIYATLQKGGKFYFSTPIGPQRIEFNGHRVFGINYLLNIFNGKYSIDNFSFVDDKGDLYENVNLDKESINNNFGCNWGCGIFELTKL